MFIVHEKIRCVFMVILTTLFCGNPLWADDTEIFFSKVSEIEAQPNILFVLDLSLSMQWYDGGSTTRVDRMRAAFTEIIQSVENVNVGVVRLSGHHAGGRVISPMRDINASVCDGFLCSDNQTSASSVSTVRQSILDTTYDMELDWGTPTTGALLESAYYYMGHPVYWGKTRWNELLHHKDETPEYSRVSHPESYTGDFVLHREADCTDADLTDPSCISEEITGDPVYISPIHNECQSNHLILITDGASTKHPDAVNKAISLTGSCPTYTRNDGRCSVEIADYLESTDLRPDIPGDQTVTTHTVGFNLSSVWLEDVASDSGGYYTAESATELAEVVKNIVNNIDTQSTSFVAPAATVDRFSRVSHRNDLYLSLFNPSRDASWAGNLKRYDLRGVPAELYDSNDPPKPVVNPNTGTFYADTKSFWSAANDGHDVAVGGAASKADYTTRKAVTYTGTAEKSLFHEDNALSVNNLLLEYNEDVIIENVASTGIATQSSTSHNGAPGRGIDGNTDGRWNRKSVTHTQNQVQPWWQLALPGATNIEEIVLYNRTNCCTDRLSDVNVFVSETPFAGETLDELKVRPDTWHTFLPGEQSPSATINVDTRGRYVRVQLEGDSNSLGILSLAEVEVYGGDLTAERIEKENILEWVIGRDVKDADADGDIDDNRYFMGDPLHSNPVTVTYGGTADNPDSIVYVGTNEGYLHAISSRDGEEQFAFMPEELIDNVSRLYHNDTSQGKIYGMDGGQTVWTNDIDGDGIIDSDSGDHAYLYSGMRRGGSSYYALDISDKEAPEFMWKINGNTNGFEEMGQTWSKMVPTYIKYGSNKKKVLVFGGGYDVSQDDKTTRSPDNVGRAIYIVDAETGALLWSGGAGDHNETQTFAQMTYSIPATPKVVDVDGDGSAEQFYVGDMGGRVWRFDINAQSDTLELDGGIIADLGTDGVFSDARRFYHTPDVSLSLQDSEYVLNIGVGSGFQAHPLNTVIDDKFYLMRIPYEYAGPGKYGIPVRNASGEITDTYTPITESDLYNATDNLIDEGTEEQQNSARVALGNAAGWLIEMERSGEKILGSSETFDGIVLFTSYIPANGEDPCSPHVGTGAFWAVDLWDATPAVDFGDDDDDDVITTNKRNKEIKTEGLPPGAQTLIVKTTGVDGDNSGTEDGGQVITMSGGNTLMSHDVRTLIGRQYWSEFPNF